MSAVIQCKEMTFMTCTQLYIFYLQMQKCAYQIIKKSNKYIRHKYLCDIQLNSAVFLIRIMMLSAQRQEKLKVESSVGIFQLFRSDFWPKTDLFMNSDRKNSWLRLEIFCLKYLLNGNYQNGITQPSLSLLTIFRTLLPNRQSMKFCLFDSLH